ncbi:MAG: AI-2E family transporter [Lachnospiraceae bacterium]|nr:AI-2E family transporter [Lachnospiraceae bacterium]
MPFVYGIVIAYLLRPTCNFFERNLRSLSRKLWKKERRGLCVGLSIALSFLLFFLIVYLLLAMMIPQLLRSIRVISVRIPLFLEVVQEWIERLFADNQVISSYLGDSVEDIETSLREWIQGSLLPSLNNVMNNFTNGVMGAFNLLYNLFVGVVAAVYILVSRKRFAAQSKLILYGALKTRVADWIYQEVCYADKMFSGFLAGKILDSTIIGVICFISCTILKIPNTMLVSVIVGVTNIIPFFGPYIGGFPSAMIILMESPVKCVWFIILIVVLQQVDGNILGPRILGNSTGLSGFWVLFSIILFSGLFGFVGMIIGVPLFCDHLRHRAAGGMLWSGAARQGGDDGAIQRPLPPGGEASEEGKPRKERNVKTGALPDSRLQKGRRL